MSLEEKSLKDKINEFYQRTDGKGQVLFLNDFDGTQSEIVPVSADARMQPAALKAARTLIELERQALESGKRPRMEYAMVSGRSPRNNSGSGAMDLVDLTIDSVYRNPSEREEVKRLFNGYMTGSFYHGAMFRRLEKQGEGIVPVETGFDPNAPAFAKGRELLDSVREKVRGILQRSPRFNPDGGEYPLQILENVGGIELNFRMVQNYIDGALADSGHPRDEAALREFYALKKEIVTAIRSELQDPSRNPRTATIGGQPAPLMKEHIERDAQGKTFEPGSDAEIEDMMGFELQPNGEDDKGKALKKMVKERREEGRPIMVIFAGDSVTGTDKNAFKAIRMGELEREGILKPGDEAVSVQVLRRNGSVNKDAELRPDFAFDSPAAYADAMRDIAEGVQLAEQADGVKPRPRRAR